MADSQDQFDWSSIAPGDEYYRLALEEYHAGRSFPEIVALLEQRGLSRELIPEVTTALAKHRAFYLFSAGKEPAQVREVLIERGLSPDDAEYIVRAVEASRDRALASVGLGKWQTRSLIAGGVLLTAGVILYSFKQLAVIEVPGELVMGLLGGGVLLGGFGGVYIAFGIR